MSGRRRAKTLIIEDDGEAAPLDEANPFSYKEFVKSKDRSKHGDCEFPQEVRPAVIPDGSQLDFIPDYQETFFKDPTMAEDEENEEGNEEENEEWSGSYRPSVVEHDTDLSQGSLCDVSYQYGHVYADDPFTTWLPNGGASPAAQPDPPNNTGNAPPGDLHVHTLQLQRENNQLKSRVQQLEEQNRSQGERVRELQRKLEERLEEEQKEARDLESMVQQIEANLRMMTKRASKAESHVTKLKQEVALLQVQLSTYKAENEALRRGEAAGMMAVKQNAGLALESLHKAVSGAQASVRQLLSGAEPLNMVAELLKSIDKIAEVHHDVL